MAQIAANLQRIKNGQRRYAITPRVPGGFIQPDQLQKYIDVANEFGAVLKLTGSQRIMITNLKAEDVDKAWEMLGMEPAYTVSNRVRSVKICPGTTFCKRAKQDSVHLGMQIERKYLSLEMPSKMKIGVSGCPNSCTESRMKDVGVIGTVEGWNVYAGGSGGAHPRIGDLIAEVKTEKEALALVDRIIAYYKENAQIERMGEFIDRIGLEAFKAAVLGDLEGAPAESKSEEPAVFLPGQGNDPEVEAPRLEAGSPITPDTIIRDIVETYPHVVPVLQGIGMGCLGCPSATAEPLWQAAEIHGFNVYDLVEKLETARKGA
ncbi:MAG: DUF1858 domain-containing protein [Veillonella parvula]|uniref:DUF1858 domain-containing protein n=1 Tax=Veillonella parvula TaxID=29466 RepID=UPI00290C91B0|nr:DUF1858 domain-containing protein [Veillonella parvula]MDU6636902.1 DUF1858 domain-containing protein [Veillonella parvula]